jgi:hypothetical protein
MIESKRKEINLDVVDGDIDDDTVMRFIEFAYTGDYTVPPPDIVLSSSDIGTQVSIHSEGAEKDQNGGSDSRETQQRLSAVTAAELVEDEFELPKPDEPVPVETFDPDHWAIPVRLSKRDRKRKKSRAPVFDDLSSEVEEVTDYPKESKKNQLWKAFCEQARTISTASWEPCIRGDSCEDFTHVLLCHAKLYIFSNRWHCANLRDLVLQKLRLTLSRHSITPDNVMEVVALLQHTYAHTYDYHDNDDEGIDTMRDLVMDFTICHIEVIEPNEEFRTMLTQGNAMARDLVGKLMKRLN